MNCGYLSLFNHKEKTTNHYCHLSLKIDSALFCKIKDSYLLQYEAITQYFKAILNY